MLSNLDKYHILLASKSPRRRELLQMLRIPFNVVVISNIDETYPEVIPAIEVPQYISEHKADAYMHRINEKDLLITADTVVISNDRIFGKPRSHEEAVEMIMSLSGHTHQVATGVTIATRTRRTSFTTVTEVTFTEVSKEEAQFYVDNYSPLDKAGAYGVQEWIGCVAVENINGSYFNVMGLPVHRLYQELKLF